MQCNVAVEVPQSSVKIYYCAFDGIKIFCIFRAKKQKKKKYVTSPIMGDHIGKKNVKLTLLDTIAFNNCYAFLIFYSHSLFSHQKIVQIPDINHLFHPTHQTVFRLLFLAPISTSLFQWLFYGKLPLPQLQISLIDTHCIVHCAFTLPILWGYHSHPHPIQSQMLIVSYNQYPDRF